MAFNMVLLVLECVYPFPEAGIPCLACGWSQKRPSLFNVCAKKVHRTLDTETPTTCSSCGKHFPSYKRVSTHYSQTHMDSKKSKAPSPTSSHAISPSSSIPSLSFHVANQASLTTISSCPPQRVQTGISLKLPKSTSPPCTSELLSAIEPTQEIIRVSSTTSLRLHLHRFLQHLPHHSPQHPPMHIPKTHTSINNFIHSIWSTT